MEEIVGRTFRNCGKNFQKRKQEVIVIFKNYQSMPIYNWSYERLRTQSFQVLFIHNYNIKWTPFVFLSYSLNYNIMTEELQESSIISCIQNLRCGSLEDVGSFFLFHRRLFIFFSGNADRRKKEEDLNHSCKRSVEICCGTEGL